MLLPELTFLTYIDQQLDLTKFPITESESISINVEHKNKYGEVFTPISIIDKMILKSKPNPTEYNLDLCAGYGNFTIRILRYFTNKYKSFNISSYLEDYHWFNELNPTNTDKIIDIFKDYKINLLIGPAQEIKHMHSDNEGIWKKGIWYWNKNTKSWVRDLVNKSEQFFEF